MSAKFDRAQGFKFYFGNAAKDLGKFLPPEEATMELGQTANSLSRSQINFHIESAEILNRLHEIADSSLDKLLKIESSKRELSFLLQDLKRIIG